MNWDSLVNNIERQMFEIKTIITNKVNDTFSNEKKREIDSEDYNKSTEEPVSPETIPEVYL